jgi:aldehyde:ferredoxin oxidoreductase
VFWGLALKFAGYKAVAITGRTVAPVYLSITDDTCEIRDAQRLWGRDPELVQARLRRSVRIGS